MSTNTAVGTVIPRQATNSKCSAMGLVLHIPALAGVLGIITDEVSIVKFV